jgi:N-acetylglucosaminyldiphosphoundecaprenol N-acetyl-beta-D-mannosaminyltransferase
MTSYILGTRVDPTSYESAMTLILDWAHKRESRSVCVANVHVIMEAYDSPNYQDMLNSSDLVTPDGMPLVWILRKLGHHEQQRVYGPELTLKLVEGAARLSIPIGFYGSTPRVLDRMTAAFAGRFPNLKIYYTFSPPFHEISEEEDKAIIEAINLSGICILFVGLGCPKQERWIAEHKGKIQAVMIGVGAAFDFHAGTKRQAPKWMMRLGLEWFFRLGQEPVRLWWRYLYHNPRFVLWVMLPMLFKHKQRTKTR